MPDDDENDIRDKAQEFMGSLLDGIDQRAAELIPPDDRVPATCVLIEFHYRFACGCETWSGALQSTYAKPDGEIESYVTERCAGHQADGQEMFLFLAGSEAFAAVMGLDV